MPPMRASQQHPPSPCGSSCEINYDTGLCDGCLRTLQEIARWSTMSEDQKREVLEAIERRRAAPR
jgi:predicted Fe-S protein YdhL (DUF1289 family)